MATSARALVPAPLSQKQRRAILRKERRKRKRQALAQAREWGLQHEESVPAEEDGEVNEEDDQTAEVERRRLLHEEWLERERLAQEEFKLKSEREEAARKRKEEEERRIKEEWEAQQRREQEEKEQKQQEKQHREEAVRKMLDEAENQLENGGPWMNPEAPVTENSVNYGTERDVANCSFFLKTGACRFGDRCSRKHIYPTTSHTLMIRGMFMTFGMEESCRDDYDIDACLEHSEEELQEYFLEFYHDVLPEFRSVGKVVQFKVSCNFEPHLRGNVYVQFDTEEKCKEALVKFNGRWYAGKQLHCELCPVTRWKNAICGLFDRQKCPKGKHCNFLHVFRNPGNEFWEADRDLHISPEHRGNRKDGRNSDRYGDRSWRHRYYNRSPPRSERSHRTGWSSERSQERRDSRHRQEDKWSSRSRHSSSRKDRCRSRSRDRSRSRSKGRERYRHHNRREDGAHRCKSRSRERDGDGRHRDSRREERDISRSTSRESEQRRERNSKNSPSSPCKNEKNSDDGNSTRHHHKHAKKSKKKRKKKHKKKSHLTEEATSSGESENDKNSEEETVESLSAASPRQTDVELHPTIDRGENSSGDSEEKSHHTHLTSASREC